MKKIQMSFWMSIILLITSSLGAMDEYEDYADALIHISRKREDLSVHSVINHADSGELSADLEVFLNKTCKIFAKKESKPFNHLDIHHDIKEYNVDAKVDKQGDLYVTGFVKPRHKNIALDVQRLIDDVSADLHDIFKNHGGARVDIREDHSSRE